MNKDKWDEINLLATQMSKLKDQNKNYKTIKIKLIQKIFELASNNIDGSMQLDEDKPIKHSDCNWDVFVDFVMQADNYDHKKNATFKTYFYRYLDYFNRDSLKKNKELYYIEDFTIDKTCNINNQFDFLFDDKNIKLPLLVQQSRLIRPLKDYIKTKDKKRKDTFFSLIFTNDCIGIIKYLYQNDNKNEYYELKLFNDEIFLAIYKDYLNEILKDNTEIAEIVDKIALNDFYEYVTVSKTKHEVEGIFLDDINMAWHLVKIDNEINLYEKDKFLSVLKKELNSKKVTINYHRNKLKKMFLELLEN